MYYLKKRLEIAGSHKLTLSYDSKCQNLHGHNWIITIYCRAPSLSPDGMITDFTHIKKAISDRLDHKNLNDIFDFNPTAENMARWICDQVQFCYRVDVQESEGNIATYTIDKTLEG